MSAGVEYKSHKKEYFVIFAVLAILTIVELFVPEMDATTLVKGTLLTILAVAKAFAVAWWYMHLNEEKAWLIFIAAIPISAAFYAFVLVLESMFR